MPFNKLILLYVILLASCTPKKQKPAITWLYGYRQVEKINGRVKKLADRYFTYSFNSKGDIIKIENFQNSSDTTTYNTVYNESGKKTESIGLYFDIGKKIKEVYKYDKNDRPIKCINDANDPSTDTDRFIYDKVGNLTEHQQYFEKKPLWIFKYRYFYNKNAVCIGVEQSMTTWRDNFKTPAKDTTRYIVFDSKNNWLKAVNFLNDTITRKITSY